MLKVTLLNANGYMALGNYPFPRDILIRKEDEDEAQRSLMLGEGLVRMSFTAIQNAAPEWVAPSWLDGCIQDSLCISRGQHFASDPGDDYYNDGLDHERVFGWRRSVRKDNPFELWNMLKSSRVVGAMA